MNDGLGLLSRFSSLLTVGFISFYIAAIFVENWSSAEDQVNTVLDAGSTTTGVDLATFTTLNTTDYTYSLDTYCVDTPIPSWNLATHQVCFNYMDNVEFCSAEGVCEKMTGCERFGNICYVRQVVKIALAVGIILGVVAATFSEKGYPFTSAVQFLAMISGIVAMGMWVDWSQRELGADAKKLKLGLGGWLITIGWLLAFIAFLASLIDNISCCCFEKKEKGGLMNDGISFLSRVGSFLSVTTWILLLVSVANPQWTTVGNLGTSGMYNTSTSNVTSGSFGVWLYCIDEVIPQFGEEPQRVCVDWNDPIAITGSEAAETCNAAAALEAEASDAAEAAATAVIEDLDFELNGSGTAAEVSASGAPECGTSGLERFADFGLKDQRRLTGFMILAAAGTAIIADVYSEKNWMGAIFMLLSSLCGMIAFASWVNFQFKLKGKGDSTELKFDEGGWVLVGAWVGAFVSSLCYFHAWRNPEDSGSSQPALSRRNSKSSHV